MNFNQYIDKYGLLVGSKEDPGDSCHRTCMYYLGIILFLSEEWLFRHKASRAITQLCYDYPNSIYVRHPSSGWWSDPDRLSRDQATPLVILMSIVNKRKLWHFFWAHLSRGFFFWNTRRNGATPYNHGKPKHPGDPNSTLYDYTKKLPDIGLSFISLYIRTLRLWPLYPLLYILDLEHLISSILWYFKKETDILNHLIVTQYSNLVYPTLWSWLALKLLNKSDVNDKLESYFNRVGMPEMAQLWAMGGK